MPPRRSTLRLPLLPLAREGSEGAAGARNRMITSVLECLRALLSRQPSPFSADESEPLMTAAEQTELRRSLNPEWRIYYRDEQGRVMDEGWLDDPGPTTSHHGEQGRR